MSGPTAIASSSLLCGSIAVQTQCDARDRRWIASSSLIFPILHGAEHGIQLIELYLWDVFLAEEVAGKGVQLLGGLHQPVQHGVGGDLKDPRGGANPQTLAQARQHPDDQLPGDLLAMQERAMMLGKGALARSTLALSPGAAIRMSIGPEVAQPEPAALATTPMWTEVPGGIDPAGTSRGRGHRIG